MLRFLAKMIVFLILLGVVLTLLWQRRVREPAMVAPAQAPAGASTPVVIVVPGSDKADGPAERIGEVMDGVLHNVGEAAMKAGKSLKEMTGSAATTPSTIVVVPQSPASPAQPAEIPRLESTAAQLELDAVESQLEALPTVTPAPPTIEQF